ncbi:MAG: HAD-IA family hydrolase [Actinobacteria bacterium]|nr:HAD-IA family hydrolase [Actinomycetota bacterium]
MIFFDLGGVLVKVDVKKFYRNVALYTGQSVEHVVQTAKDFFPDAEKFERGLITSNEFYDLVFREHYFKINYDQFRRAYVDIFNLKKDVFEIAQTLKRNYRISIISNTDVLHYNYIEQNFAVLQIFDHPTTSFETHSLKPEKKIYNHALKKFNLPPGACIFIDDKEENVAGAQSLGMAGIHFLGAEDLKQKLSTMNVI